MSAVLVGGYHGSWLTAAEVGDVRLSRTGLKDLGASPGAGIVHALGTTECGLARTAEITRYLADESARQCGPCLNGLPRIAELMDQLAFGRSSDSLVSEVRRMARLVDGRGSSPASGRISPDAAQYVAGVRCRRGTSPAQGVPGSGGCGAGVDSAVARPTKSGRRVQLRGIVRAPARWASQRLSAE